MLEQLPLPPEQVRVRARQAADPAYWRRLCPGQALTVDGATDSAVEIPALTNDTAAMVRQLQQAGYFKAGPVLEAEQALGMRQVVEAVRSAGWPAAFCFVYDDFWRVWSAPPLTSTLNAVLGEGYQLIPLPWCWYVPATSDARGWGPHADGWNRPNRISIWIALSDATLDNGCIYVIPKDRVADLPVRTMAAGRSQWPWRGWAPLLQSSRALPTRAGSAIAWDFQTIHWGSVCHQPVQPRISIACYFMARNCRPRREEKHLFDPHRLPTFPQRLWAIASSIRYYRLNDLRNGRYLQLADRVTQHARKQSGGFLH